ncbi:putative ribosome-binding factor A, mitochondrial [Glandiceps talaboti]
MTSIIRCMCLRHLSLLRINVPTRLHVLSLAEKHAIRNFSNSSPVCMKRKTLQKLFKKTKRKFYLPGSTAPQLGLNLDQGPRVRTKPGHTSRLHVINTVLYKNIVDLVQSSVVSSELGELNVEVLSVKMANDFSVCLVFWQATGTLAEDDNIQQILDKHAGSVRHYLTQLRLVGFLPKLSFVKDKGAANLAEVERLLSDVQLSNTEEDAIDEYIDLKESSSHTDYDLFSLNHSELHKQINKFKKNKKDISLQSAERKNYEEFKIKKFNKRKSSAGVEYESNWDDESDADDTQYEDETSQYEEV